MADPATAFPQGDPRNAQYNEQLAKIAQARSVEKTEGEGARKRLGENAAYAEGQVKKQEPGGYRNLRNRSNKEGLLRSGIQSERHGTLQSQYAARRYAITHGREESEGALGRSEAANERDRQQRESGAATNALARAQQYAQENPAAPPAAPAAPAVAQAAARRVGGKYVRGPKGERIYQAWA